jgi:hypothetical protein
MSKKGSGGKRQKSKARVAKGPKVGATNSPATLRSSPIRRAGGAQNQLVQKQTPIHKEVDPAFDDQLLLLRQVVTLKNAPPLTQVPVLKPLKQFVAKPALQLKLGFVLLRISVIAATLVGGILGLIPRTNLTLSNPVDPEDPFSSLVTVTNTGYLPLLSVTWQMALQKVSARNGGVSMEGAPNYTTRFHHDDWPSHRLGAGDQLTFALNEVFHTCKQGFRSADIAIVVDYEIPLIHLRVEKLYPLAAKSQTNGNFYWYSNAQTLPAEFSFPSPVAPSEPLRSLPILERSSFVGTAPVFSASAVR